MQHAITYRAWLPSEIFSLLFSPILKHSHISERFQRSTKRGKSSRAAWEFDRHNRKSQSKTLARYVYYIASIFTPFCAYARQL